MNDRQNRKPNTFGAENLKLVALTATFLALASCGGGGSDNTDELVEPEFGAANTEASNPDEVSSVEVSAANTNVAETVAGSPLQVSVLQNDIVAKDARVELVGQPANGSATILDNGRIEYTANRDFEGTETIEYKIVDARGNESRGTLYVAVVCADCTLPTVASNSEGFPYCIGTNPDPDGDGYGWEENTSCVVPALGAALDPLAARSDIVEIRAGEVKTVLPLRNDSIADRSTVDFNIDVQPTAGRILAAEAGIFVYSAPENFSGSDSMMYRIKDIEGRSSVASIDFNITCSTCVDHKGLRLSWPENPETEGVEGYRVLFGSDNNPLTATVVSEVRISDLNGEAPNVIFDLQTDLNVARSEGGCFMIKAYRGSEESEASEAACFTRG